MIAVNEWDTFEDRYKFMKSCYECERYAYRLMDKLDSAFYSCRQISIFLPEDVAADSLSKLKYLRESCEEVIPCIRRLAEILDCPEKEGMKVLNDIEHLLKQLDDLQYLSKMMSQVMLEISEYVKALCPNAPGADELLETMELILSGLHPYVEIYEMMLDGGHMMFQQMKEWIEECEKVMKMEF